ncbi:RNA polymerase sigma (SigV) subunit [Lacrimispora xylanisolvens]|uniref:RNA polymerase sigma (SigV) subunit n=1 Tax=Lacrimispora xylanisolvens TaxID=384636 RepID=A0A2S6HJR9_9FIRM|nr:RNA polymerase sigma factor [Hungatella xylanolytica]MBE5986865.1 RNA polymerase sigma factor [Paenibacillaceae bacterium]PPK77623.1 RNA polymerase sigma (SigV) subunit [Hungatella xylanolytica]
MKQKIEEQAESLLLNNYEKYYRLAYSYAKNESDALDIVQESAYKVLKDIKKLKDQSLLSTWIYRIVINTSIDFLRKRNNETVSIYDLEIPHEDQYQDDDPKEMIAFLNEEERTIVILKFFEDLKLEEIADALNMNVNTVKTRLYRALKKIRVTLETEHV